MGTVVNSNYIDNSSQIANRLTLLFGSHGYAYLATNNASEVTSFKRYNHALKDPNFIDSVLNQLGQDENLKEIGSAQIEISLFTPNFTLVPVPIYREAYKNLYLERNTLPTDHLSWVDSLTTRDYVKVIFSVPPKILKLQSYLGTSSRISHLVSKMAKSFYLQYAQHHEQIGLIQVRDEQLLMLLFDEGKLMFSNVFRFRTNEDFYYFITLVVAKLDLKPNKLKLMLSGEIYQDTSKHNWLNSRFSKIDFVKYSLSQVNISKLKIQNHEIYDLLSITAN